MSGNKTGGGCQRERGVHAKYSRGWTVRHLHYRINKIRFGADTIEPGDQTLVLSILMIPHRQKQYYRGHVRQFAKLRTQAHKNGQDENKVRGDLEICPHASFVDTCGRGGSSSHHPAHDVARTGGCVVHTAVYVDTFLLTSTSDQFLIFHPF